MNINHGLALASVAAVLCLSAGQLGAQQAQDQGQDQGQGRGNRPNRGNGGGGQNFDPAQFQQRIMEGYKERLEVTKDDEWKIIEERITKVTEARRELAALGGGGRGGFGGFGRGGGRGGNDPGADNAGGGRRGGGGLFGGTPSPELEALQKAIDSKASKEELMSKMAAVRQARKGKEEKLAKAQEDLRKVLTTRQEATSITMGLVQ